MSTDVKVEPTSTLKENTSDYSATKTEGKLDEPKLEVQLDVPKLEKKLEVPKSEEKISISKSEENRDVPKSEKALHVPTSEEKLNIQKSEGNLDVPKLEEKVDVPESEKEFVAECEIKQSVDHSSPAVSSCNEKVEDNIQKTESLNGDCVDTRERDENAEDIKSGDDDDDDEGSLFLDDFLDGLDVLDSWNPDEDELVGIDVDQSSQSTRKEEKPIEKTDKKGKDDRRNRKHEDDKRNRSGSSRKRSVHMERSVGRPSKHDDLLGSKVSHRRPTHRDRSPLSAGGGGTSRHLARGGGEDLVRISPQRDKGSVRRRTVHRESSLERPARTRNLPNQEDLKDVIDREVAAEITAGVKGKRESRDKKDIRPPKDSKERHRETGRSKEKVKGKTKEKPKDNEIKPPPGAKPVPHIKLPSDDLVPPGTEDEYWAKEGEEEGQALEDSEANGDIGDLKDGGEVNMSTGGDGTTAADEAESEDGCKVSKRVSASTRQLKERRTRSSEKRQRNERFNKTIRRERSSKINLLRSRDEERDHSREWDGRGREKARGRDWADSPLPPRVRSRSPRRHASRSPSPRRHTSRSPRRRISREREQNRRLSPPLKRFRRSRSRSRERVRERRLASDRERRSRSLTHRIPERSSRRSPVTDLREVLDQRSSSNRRSADRSAPSQYLYERFSSPSLSFELSPVSSGDRLRSLSRSLSRELRPPTRRARRSYTPLSDVSLSLSPEPYPENLRPRKRIPFVKELERMFAAKLDGYPTAAYRTEEKGAYNESGAYGRTVRRVSRREDGTSLEAPPPPVISEDKLYETSQTFSSFLESSAKDQRKAAEVAPSVAEQPFAALLAASGAQRLSEERRQLLLLRCEEAIRTLAADGGLSMTGRFILNAPDAAAHPPAPPLTFPKELKSPVLRHGEVVRLGFCEAPAQQRARRATRWGGRGLGSQTAQASKSPPPPCPSCEERRKVKKVEAETQTEKAQHADTASQCDPPPPTPPKETPTAVATRGPKKVYKPEDSGSYGWSRTGGEAAYRRAAEDYTGGQRHWATRDADPPTAATVDYYHSQQQPQQQEAGPPSYMTSRTQAGSASAAPAHLHQGATSAAAGQLMRALPSGDSFARRGNLQTARTFYTTDYAGDGADAGGRFRR